MEDQPQHHSEESDEEVFEGFSQEDFREKKKSSNENKMESLKAKIAEREEILRCLQRQEDFLHNFTPGDQKFVQARLRRVRSCLEQFQNVTRSMRLIEGSVAANEALLDETDERCMVLIGEFEEKLQSFTSKNVMPVSVKEEKRVRLPRLALPEFSGNYEDWLPFHSLFVSAVHGNTGITDTEKMMYLKGALKGDASSVVDAFPTCGSAYEAAWNALNKRYANEYLLKKRYTKELLRMPKIKMRKAKEIHHLIEGFERNTKLLDQLGESSSNWGMLLVELVLSKLDEETQQKWEQHLEDKSVCSVESLFEFLRMECRVLDATAVDHRASTSSQKNDRRVANLATEQQQNTCAHCGKLHAIALCKAFLELTVDGRYDVAIKKKLCLNCLAPGHWAAKCFSRARCTKCNKRHHETLHKEGTKEDPTVGAVTMLTSFPKSKSAISNQVMLSTAMVQVKCRNGNWIAVRVLLDNGSQVNIMTNDLHKRLKLPKCSESIVVSGIGNLTKNAPITRTFVASNDRAFYEDVNFLVMSAITDNQPSKSVHIGIDKLPKNIVLADPKFDEKGPIDMLLGAEYFADFLHPKCEIIPASHHHPAFLKTVFGWVAVGKTISAEDFRVSCNVATIEGSSENLAQSIERFWTIEELQQSPQVSQKDMDCEASFGQHHRDVNGRYVVRLPFQVGLQEGLGKSKENATKRFLQLERRFNRDPTLKKEYSAVIADYIGKEYMKKVMIDETTDDPQNHYYLPHHPVIKASSTTTKIRPVFDGSAKTDTEKSLNDLLLVGPVIQESLFTLLLKFRMRKIALVADIRQMYLQVKVHHDHTRYQRILWRDSPDKPIDVFELQRVTFGLASSSFLATRVLQQLALDEGDSFPMAKSALLEDFYVDDYIGGANSEEEAIQLQAQLTCLLEKGGFHLTKWNSNITNVLDNVPAEDMASSKVKNFEAVEEPTKALGVSWNTETDKLFISTSLQNSIDTWTRRKVYSLVAKIFDPLGLVAPVTAWAKIQMQALWLSTQSWDEPIPSHMERRWNDFYAQIPYLASIQFQRYAIVDDPATLQLHCFSDASEAAYGACIYVRAVDSNGNVKVTLLAGKSRPAPLKRISLARLELCGALLSAKLQKTVRQVFGFLNTNVYMWTDSTIVLHWIRSPSYTWTTFVANRVSQVQELTKECKWLHVRGTENPADVVSRGALPHDLLLKESWFHGPSWMGLSESQWRTSYPSDMPEDEVIEKRICTTAVLKTDEPEDWCARFSNFEKLLRVTARCLRVVGKYRHKEVKQNSDKYLSIEELRNAKMVLVKRLQQQHFASEIRELANGKSVPAKSTIRTLGAFLDESGFLRVGGRLRGKEMELGIKHPLVLPKRAQFSRLAAEYYHRISLHGGPTMTLSMMRREFWPLQGRSLVNKVCRSCLPCFRLSPALIQQPQGLLPAERASPGRPFAVVGVDFAGPVYLKPVHRKAASEKAYICVFVCFSVKAVHVELVESLSTQAFMAAFHRFVARRGLPSQVYSDNGLNFQGARNHLKELYDLLRSDSAKEAVLKYATDAGIKWHFIPPHAPNFGGLWEAAVKVVKRTMTKVIGERRLSFSDLATILSQVEAQLNSRPLTPLSEDPAELNVLTPAHFLIGAPLNTVPEIDVTAVPVNRLRHYEQLQLIIQTHWKRWRGEYLCELHNENQRRRVAVPLSVGQMVILKEDGKMPLQWPLGRISKLFPGLDGVVRVVNIRTKLGEYKRPVSRICLLPFENERM
ncbi:uncharacterized protein LOC125761030 [Anopheles funestus]|uniref:uncharacterized protein LOC125761030 n=1 Tax=Anopheles funestus TaxID=62324 RepID=UPI0020C6DCC7|nr:uncharacterized protein LOC125761030 [Anopheles funestus]